MGRLVETRSLETIVAIGQLWDSEVFFCVSPGGISGVLFAHSSLLLEDVGRRAQDMVLDT